MEDGPMNEDTLIAKLNMIAVQINHEDELIGVRVSWLVISQSFLFGTFAALVGQKGVVGPEGGAVRLLLTLIPLVGMLLPWVRPPTRSGKGAPSTTASARWLTQSS
jgi:hypothetical protein